MLGVEITTLNSVYPQRSISSKELGFETAFLATENLCIFVPNLLH